MFVTDYDGGVGVGGFDGQPSELISQYEEFDISECDHSNYRTFVDVSEHHS